MPSTREIRLSEELCQAAEKRFGQRFASVDELIVTMLQQLLRDDAFKMDENEQQIVEQRLRNLGYV